MAPRYRIDPRIRALGKARLDVTRRARDEKEWQRLWRAPRYPFPFVWGEGWRACFQYYVDDFAAEIGFLMDVLGLPVSAFSTTYALFTSPDQAFFFAVRQVPEGFESTPPDSIRLQFMLSNFSDAIQELERRGVTFEVKPEPGGFDLAVFRTPHGVPIEIWPAAQPRPPEVNRGRDQELSSAFPSERQAWQPAEAGNAPRLDEGEKSLDAGLPQADAGEVANAADEPIYVDDEEAAAGSSAHGLQLLQRRISPSRGWPNLGRNLQKSNKGNGMRLFPTLNEGDH